VELASCYLCMYVVVESIDERKNGGSFVACINKVAYFLLFLCVFIHEKLGERL